MGGFFSGFGFGDLLGGVTSVAGSIANAVTSKKARKWQSQENERQRQYMSELASRQNQWNLEQWNRENAYNSPSNKMKLLKEAGLNPDLMYGQGAGSLQAASSPQLTAGEAGPTMDYSKFMPNLELSSIAQNMANARLADAQAKLANSQANKTDTETSWIDRLNQSTLDMNSMTVQLGEAELPIKRATADQIGKNMQVLDELIQNYRVDRELTGEKVLTEQQNRKESESRVKVNEANANLISEKEFSERFYRGLRQKEVNAIVRDLTAKANLSERQYFEMCETWFVRKQIPQAQLNIMAEQYGLTAKQGQILTEQLLQEHIKTEKATLDLRMFKTWAEKERALQYVTNVVALLRQGQELYLRPMEVGSKALSSAAQILF